MEQSKRLSDVDRTIWKWIAGSGCPDSPDMSSPTLGRDFASVALHDTVFTTARLARVAKALRLRALVHRRAGRNDPVARAFSELGTACSQTVQNVQNDRSGVLVREPRKDTAAANKLHGGNPGANAGRPGRPPRGKV